MKRKCNICEEIFPTAEELDEHKQYHDPSDRIVCRRCGHLSLTLKRHKTHALKCHTCSLCGKNCGSGAVFETHNCVINNGKRLVCPCGIEFEKYEDIVRHTRGPKPMFCCECNQPCITISNIIKHFRKHLRKQVFECSECQKTFVNRSKFKAHVSAEHLDHNQGDMDKAGQVREQCNVCGRSIAAAVMVNHLAKHKISSCLCPDCGKMFDSPFKLSHHLPQHYPDPVTCDICRKVLKTKKILAEHLKTHMTTAAGGRVAQAICPHCGLELAQKGSLQRHIMLVHERHKLKRIDKPRSCKVCGMTLPNSAKYYSHMRWHRAEKERFPCTVCSREFNKKHNLIRHMYLLHEQRRFVPKEETVFISYSCQTCFKTFTDCEVFQKHCISAHKDYDMAL